MLAVAAVGAAFAVVAAVREAAVDTRSLAARFGSTVTVTVSTGAETVTVPDLINSTTEQAVQALKDAGFANKPEVREVLNANVTEGLVFWQNRSQGESVSPDTVIEINVAIAPQEEPPPDEDPGTDDPGTDDPNQNTGEGDGE